MRVYLCGPMTGQVMWNFPLFDVVADHLTGLGFGVWNPARICRAEGFDPETLDPTKALPDRTIREIARRDCIALLECDAIAIMKVPGWGSSRGVAAEVAVAKWVGLKVYSVDVGPRMAPGSPRIINVYDDEGKPL